MCWMDIEDLEEWLLKMKLYGIFLVYPYIDPGG